MGRLPRFTILHHPISCSTIPDVVAPCDHDLPSTSMHPNRPKLLLIFVLLVTSRIGLSADNKHDLPRLERSFWLHASLVATAQKGYWGPAYPASSSPTESDIRNAAKLLTDTYAANRLRLFYHGEIILGDAEQVFR